MRLAHENPQASRISKNPPPNNLAMKKNRSSHPRPGTRICKTQHFDKYYPTEKQCQTSDDHELTSHRNSRAAPQICRHAHMPGPHVEIPPTFTTGNNFIVHTDSSGRTARLWKWRESTFVVTMIWFDECDMYVRTRSFARKKLGVSIQILLPSLSISTISTSASIGFSAPSFGFWNRHHHHHQLHQPHQQPHLNSPHLPHTQPNPTQHNTTHLAIPQTDNWSIADAFHHRTTKQQRRKYKRSRRELEIRINPIDQLFDSIPWDCRSVRNEQTDKQTNIISFNPLPSLSSPPSLLTYLNISNSKSESQARHPPPHNQHPSQILMHLIIPSHPISFHLIFFLWPLTVWI